jgi:hypothetical protein
MKLILYIVSVILILAGGVFALQGMSLLPSRVMYGKPEWIVIGAGMIIVGAVIIFSQRRAKAPSPL